MKLDTDAQAAQYIGASIYSIERPGEWTLCVWKMQRTMWGYSLHNPMGGSGGSSTSYRNANHLVIAQLGRVPTHMGARAGDQVLVLVGASTGDPDRIVRAYYAPWGAPPDESL